MASRFVSLDHAVEEERVDVIVEKLVVEETFREERQVAAPRALFPTVDLEKRDIVVAIDLVARWMMQCAFRKMTLEHQW